MEQGFTQDMQTKIIGMILNLAHNPGKILWSHKGFGPIAGLAEAAGEIAAIGDLDKNLFKSFQAAKDLMICSAGSTLLKNYGETDHRNLCSFYDRPCEIEQRAPLWRQEHLPVA